MHCQTHVQQLNVYVDCPIWWFFYYSQMRPINQIVFNVVFISTLKTQKERATPSLHMLTFAELAISMCKNCPLPSMSHFYSSNIATSISQYTIVIVYSLLLSTLCIVHVYITSTQYSFTWYIHHQWLKLSSIAVLHSTILICVQIMSPYSFEFLVWHFLWHL